DGSWSKGDGRVTTDVSYDACGRVVRVVDDETGTARMLYDAHGRLLVHVSAGGDIERYRYDRGARAVEIERGVHSPEPQHPATRTFHAKAEYDGLGRVTRMVDGAGNATRYEYDEFGELFHVLD